MEDIVVIDQWQKFTTDDGNRLGTYARRSLDHVVKDLGPSWGFTGFATTISAPAVVTVGNGRLFDPDGKVYPNADAGGVALDFLTTNPGLPAVTKRIAAIVVWGQELLSNTEPRTFITDVTTRATEARPKATTSTRYANIGVVVGIEGPDPQKPAVANNVLVVAWATLDPTGVVSVIPEENNRVRSLKDHSTELDTLENFRKSVGAALDTLNTMIANLAGRVDTLTPHDEFLRLIVDVTRLKEKADLPDSYAAWGSDYFLDEEESDLANINYNARIEEGLRFPKAAENTAQLALANILDANVRVASNFLLPKYHEIRRLANVSPVTPTVALVLPWWEASVARTLWLLGVPYRPLFATVVVVAPSEISISQFANQSFPWKRAFPVRYRWRWGAPYFKTSRQNYWFNLRYDPIWWTFHRRVGDSGFVILTGPPYPQPVPLPLTPFAWRYGYIRTGWFWHDYITDHYYWDRVLTTGSVNGSVVAQTFLNAQDGWLTGMHLFFTRRGAAGDVTILLCETNESGQPQKDRAIASATLLRTDINTWPYATRVDFSPPVLLTQGKRYAFIPITSGAHFLATTDRNQLISGTLFYSTDQVWFQGLGDMSRDLCFELIYAEFESTRFEIQLAPATLTGGIAAIDINADAQVPDGTELTFQAQIAGQWVALTDPGPDGQPLTSLPALANMRMVFTGTPALHAGIAIGTNSEIYTWRPGTSVKHISDVRTLGVAVTSTAVTVRLENWLGGAHHTAVIKLLSGAGYTTVTTAAAVVDTVAPDDTKALIRKATFTGLASLTTYKIQIEGTTDSALTPWHGAERIDIAQA